MPAPSKTQSKPKPLTHVMEDYLEAIYDLGKEKKVVRVKDIAQLHYLAPGQYFSRTDRLRFYLEYAGQSKLAREDKVFIRKVINKTRQMVRHNVKHGRPAPFATKKQNQMNLSQNSQW